MSHGYSHARVQAYWQRVWERAGVYELPQDAEDPTYVLGMFPYTSGSLHMGHVRNYAITDAYARYRRMRGDDVLHPMGWDAFGLPAENAAYERDTDPASWTRTCIEQMREELRAMGFGYDWSREVTTCHPEYYRWNQWLFTRLYEAGLVEYRGATVNWCPDCETVLADAQVDEVPVDDSDAGSTGSTGRAERAEKAGHVTDTAGVCWRCETPVEARELDQWFFTITDYAEELHAGLDELDGWPEGVRDIQRNWIGRREGARVAFDVPGHGTVDAFTTRLDTVYGATFVALSPGHDLASVLADENPAVAEYVDSVGDPDAAGTSGVDTEVVAVHPLTGEELPVYVAAYVLDDVGTGAVMGVPAHNERDHAFARDHGLPVRRVIDPVDEAGVEVSDEPEPFTDDGALTNSGEYDGLPSADARERLLDEARVEPAVTYRLRDWLVSRQRYWGTPIPIVHCQSCGHVPVPDEDLPVELPAFVQTTGNPLSAVDSFVETECPDCGRPARRETDTMDTFVDSSWYFLRFLSPTYEDGPFDPEVANEWMPVDVYVGGAEHATLHLLYVRFFTRALADLGLLDVREPVEQLVTHGTVLHGGEKMSKSKGNAIAPHEYGPETTRLFVLSAAHPRQDFEWTATDVGASYDFLQTLYAMVDSFVDGEVRVVSAPHDIYLEREIDRTVAAATDEYERVRYHRVVSELRGFARLLRRYSAFQPPYKYTYHRALRTLTRLVAPLTPYLAEELWSLLGEDGLVAGVDWPEPLRDVPHYRIERRVVRDTLEDVRRIVDVVGIEDPEVIELTVAPDWKFRAHELAREAEPGAVVGRGMDDPAVRQRGETAADYAADLAARQAELRPVIDGEQERAVLERATWLFVDEFGADVTVRRASEDGKTRKAEPNRPAIDIR